jgi:AraC-like DNA-binding protein
MKAIFRQKGRDPLYKIWNYSENNMIIYFQSDGGSIVFKDEIYPILKGSLCFVSAYTKNYTMPTSPNQYERSKIFLSKGLTDKLLSISTNTPFYNFFNENSVIYAKIPLIDQEYVEREFEFVSKLEKTSNIEYFLSSFYRLMVYIYKFSTKSINSNDDQINLAIKYINQNIDKKLSLETVCAQVHLSKYYFSRQFKKALGINFSEYLIKTRIEFAKDLLLNTSLNVTEISEKCGFSGLSYFSQIFNQKVGVSPLEFRTSNKN